MICAILLSLTGCASTKLNVKEENVTVEYGEEVSVKPEDYLSNDKDVLSEVEVSTDIENEDGKTYPSVGEYEITFSYEKQEAKVDVAVTDTTAPKFIDFKDTADTYLNNKVDFASIYTAEDLSEVKITYDDSKVDYAVAGTYTATVTATDSAGNTETKEVTVNVIAVTVQLDKTSVSIYKGETAQLTATTNIPEEKIVFSSSDNSIATVDENGLVTGVKVGKAVITAEVNGVKAECEITVSEKSNTSKPADTTNKNPATNTETTNKNPDKNTASSGSTNTGTNSDSTNSGNSNGGSTNSSGNNSSSNTGGNQSNNTTQETPVPQVSKEAFDLINAERIKLGLEPAVWDAECEEIAYWRAEQLGKLDNVTPENGHTGFIEWVNADLNNRWMFAECIGYGYSSAENAVNGWMNSKGHRDALMEEERVYLAIMRIDNRWVAINSYY